MNSSWKKKLLVGGMAAALTIGGAAGCGNGNDQDDGIDNDQQDDQLDQDNDVMDDENNDNDLMDEPADEEQEAQ
ncbi:hypothetical protein BTO30_10990 [Domibacillus antri]|uniref:Uncharacterized protein n=1 Tax=Domibacillus antri TaxID=1714264 RepID=A0A1Q8Q4I5_9BACI|nr:hypothetical protein [Domibacillus antri]OLN22266.1 hypothetical protein BTO30_10990 [Domibacillus antri]